MISALTAAITLPRNLNRTTTMEARDSTAQRTVLGRGVCLNARNRSAGDWIEAKHEGEVKTGIRNLKRLVVLKSRNILGEISIQRTWGVAGMLAPGMMVASTRDKGPCRFTKPAYLTWVPDCSRHPRTDALLSGDVREPHSRSTQFSSSLSILGVSDNRRRPCAYPRELRADFSASIYGWRSITLGITPPMLLRFGTVERRIACRCSVA
ncbi:hypothetical protein B0H16DRAFT_1478386 [Mycena metata]|uniref:Uncharacterized protein n=1 Tax=Mycena metata TaxID=1033252 RepID=A0AAD7MEG7_9AGAR|nr:hypothetical protein B0H16DRAFT_1478386 [Mycena metata]